MELRAPRTVLAQIATERLERQPHGLAVDLLPIHGLGRVAAVHGGEVDALAILVRRHELHLGETRVERVSAGRGEPFPIADRTVRVRELCHLHAIPRGIKELPVWRDAHLRAVEPFQQHCGGNALDRWREAELAVPRLDLHLDDKPVCMPPCKAERFRRNIRQGRRSTDDRRGFGRRWNAEFKRKLRRLEPRRLALAVEELERERLHRRHDAFRAVRDKRLHRTASFRKAQLRA